MQLFKKILIANRGEIAVRITRACHELGIAAVAVYSDVDRASLHVRLADEAYPIGPAPSRESYLRIDKLIDVARHAQCDALHPGYGFLAENPELPQACKANKVTFIGPSAEAMARLGSKTAARQLARTAGVPRVPGTLDPVEKLEDAQRFAREHGYPLMLKAVAGGGGKGMRRVASAEELPSAWRDASSEALNAFGNGRLYLEKYLENPRHIEIQVFGDHHGNVTYLGERECSVQRRHQKVIEEAPSPIVDQAMRASMGEAAVKLARAGGYANAGTLEFLVDAKKNFYFLEMNTRLQVEHPVTEFVTGLDLVKMQIRIAAGEPLPPRREIIPRGHALECRVYAEDPDNNFFPSPGKILARRVPNGPGIRMDEGVYPGWVVPNEYDPLLGKLIVWAGSREEAIARMLRALDEYYVSGIKTNVTLFQRILRDPQFRRGEIHTGWLDEWLARDIAAHKKEVAARKGTPGNDAAVLAAALWQMDQSGPARPMAASAAAPASDGRWKLEGRRALVDRIPRS
jgi:acetyl-CoA carboxylase biotin carboxylase subunit